MNTGTNTSDGRRNNQRADNINNENEDNIKYSPGKRWKVVEVKNNGIYSSNPFPGAITVHRENNISEKI